MLAEAQGKAMGIYAGCIYMQDGMKTCSAAETARTSAGDPGFIAMKDVFGRT